MFEKISKVTNDLLKISSDDSEKISETLGELSEEEQKLVYNILKKKAEKLQKLVTTIEQEMFSKQNYVNEILQIVQKVEAPNSIQGLDSIKSALMGYISKIDSSAMSQVLKIGVNDLYNDFKKMFKPNMGEYAESYAQELAENVVILISQAIIEIKTEGKNTQDSNDQRE